MNIIIKIGRYFGIHITVVLMFAAAFAGGWLPILSITYLTAFLHELCHLFTAFALGLKVSGILVMPYGLSLRVNGPIPPAKEFLVCLAGPVSNVLLGALTVIFRWGDALLYTNVCFFALNILPVLPLDGGRMLKSALTAKMGALKAYNLTNAVTIVTIALMGVGGVWLFVLTGYNYSVAIISVFLLFNLASDRGGKHYAIMREMVYSHEKLRQRRVLKCSRLAALCTASAPEIIKRFKGDRYYIIDIIDEEGHIVGQVTETNVITAMIMRSTKISMAELLAESESPPNPE